MLNKIAQGGEDKNGTIKSVAYIKFLGVYIDTNVFFNIHINTLPAKISRPLGLPYNSTKFLPEGALLKIYY